jgi:hypothetical protein
VDGRDRPGHDACVESSAPEAITSSGLPDCTAGTLPRIVMRRDRKIGIEWIVEIGHEVSRTGAAPKLSKVRASPPANACMS